MTREQRLTATYAAFNARDIDQVLAQMTDDVDWPNAWEGGRVVGHDAERAYWTRQWAEIDPEVQPQSLRELPDGRIAVTVHQIVRALDGSVLSDGIVLHRYTFRGEQVARMDVLDPPTRRATCTKSRRAHDASTAAHLRQRCRAQQQLVSGVLGRDSAQGGDE